MKLSRRDFGGFAGAAALVGALDAPRAAERGIAGESTGVAPLAQFDYGAIEVTSRPHREQLESTVQVLMHLSEDSLLKPYRQMLGQPAPGADLGGWYTYDPHYDWRRDDAGFAPGATFGQWISALARYHAQSGSVEARAKVLRLNRLYAHSIGGAFYELNRFPAYCYDKLVLGLLDSHTLASDPDAFALLERTTDAALPFLPARAIDRNVAWRPGKDESFRWDESYTSPENLFLAYRAGAGRRYRDLAVRFLDDATWFDPLARGDNVLAGKHAYSYVNSLSSAMQAYLTLGSRTHLAAARNAFGMLTAQSYPTGGWGPNEQLVAPGSGALGASLTASHSSFETPCGAYAHFKLTRYLLRVTRESRYGDSMERVMYNTVLGAKPLQADGHAFYYSDYNFLARKVYSNHRFPCCSGTLPQVAADYGISSYLRDPRGGVYVNLYLPSTVRWREGSTRCALTQMTAYPFEDTVSIAVDVSQPQEFALHVRIPAWATGAGVAINGARVADAEPGRFAALRRTWRAGDRVELELPRRLRLEPIDLEHRDTVTLLCGPLALFAVLEDGADFGERGRPRRSELLAARQVSPQRWQARSGSKAVTLLPFTAIDAESYTTCLTAA